MTRRVYKYTLLPKNQFVTGVEFEVDIPIGAKPLTVDFDPEGALSLWALVDPQALRVKGTVTVRGTGHSVPDDAGEFVNTFMRSAFVFHAFYLQNS